MSPRQAPHRTLAVALVLVMAPLPSIRADVHEPFETAETTWRMETRDCALHGLDHRRVFDQAHSGQGSEAFQFHAGQGTHVHWVHAIGASRVIDELAISVWLKSDRRGLRVQALAVLPRSRHPETGRPLTTLLNGSIYDQVGTWQKLTVSELSKQLTAKLPLLRSEFGSDVSLREAYVSWVVINGYGGPGLHKIWVDDLEVVGQVSPTDIETRTHPPPAAHDPGSTPRLQGTVLVANERPLLVRMIEHQGEPLQWLRSLGFNTVKINGVPDEQLLAESRQTGLWLVCHPPDARDRRPPGHFDRVIAWTLDRALWSRDPQLGQHVVQRIRRRDARPVVLPGSSGIWRASHAGDIVLINPPPLGGSHGLSQFSNWFIRQSNLARFGTPWWADLPSEPHGTLAHQIQALDTPSAGVSGIDPDQLRLMAFQAVATGARGISISSSQPLNSPDPQSRIRALSLERLNLELALLEPWASAGTTFGQLMTNESRVQVHQLETQRSRMLVVFRHCTDQQAVVAAPQGPPVSFSVGGIPITDDAYEVSDSGLRRLRQSRAGGVHISVERPDLISLFVLTQDPLVVNFLTRQLKQTQRRRNEVVRELLSLRLDQLEGIQRQLAAQSKSVPDSDAWLAQARADLDHYTRLLRAGGHENASQFAANAHWQMARIRRAHWEFARRFVPVGFSSPLLASFETLPGHWRLTDSAGQAAWGPNELAGGDFEDLSQLSQTGWRNERFHEDVISTAVELSLHAPHSGRHALRMRCWATDDGSPPPASFEMPPVRIVTPPTPLAPGQRVLIQGWVRTVIPASVSHRGLMIRDSLGNEPLVQNIASDQWRQFTLLRAAGSEPLVVSFELDGIGEAWLDDVVIRKQ